VLLGFSRNPLNNLVLGPSDPIPQTAELGDKGYFPASKLNDL